MLASESQELKPNIIEIKKEEEITITITEDEKIDVIITRKVIAS